MLVESKFRVRLGSGLPFGLESSAFSVRVSVGIDDLEVVLESSTLGLELWLDPVHLGFGLGLGLGLCLGEG